MPADPKKKGAFFKDDEPTDPEIAVPLQSVPAVNPANRRTPAFSLGPLDPFLKDPLVTEIIVNDLRNVVIERKGSLEEAAVKLESPEELNRLGRLILDMTGRVLTPDSPYADVHLPDGSRVNLVGPPIAMDGLCITIRKFPSNRYTLEDLVSRGAMDARIAQFLHLAVMARANFLVAGGTNTGKTTLINAMLASIPPNERVVLIEDTPELTLPNRMSVRLQVKPQMPGTAPISARELLRNSLRMRPDRVIVGECRGAEALDMMQAMNTGHDGSMTSVHANSPRDALSRIETLALFAQSELPHLSVRQQMARAIDFLVQIKRFRDGTRRVVAVSEMTGMENQTILLQDLFYYATEEDGKSPGFRSTGYTPHSIDKLNSALAEHGLEFPQAFFG